MKTFVSTLALGVALLSAAPIASAGAAPATAAVPTAADADKFVAQANAEAAKFSDYASRVAWVNATYITDDTDWLAARMAAQGTEMAVRWAKQAATFNATPGLSYDTRRQLDGIKLAVTLPAPDTPGAADELATLTTRMQSAYGKGKGTAQGKPTGGNDLEALMATTRDPAQLQEMWTSWHKVGAPMRPDYVRMVQIANQGARDLGYKDVGAMWRAGYDMDPDSFA
jgi:peptidyl-dipeptidase A